MLIGATSAITTCVVGNIYFEEKKLQKRKSHRSENALSERRAKKPENLKTCSFSND